MNEPTSFQTQYPLSPKKFWKKITGSLFATLCTIILLLVVLWPILHLFILQGSGANANDFRFGLYIPIGIIIARIVWNIIYAIYIKAYIKRYYYDCGDQFITIKKGVFAPTEIHVQYQKIQDVYVDQDILDRIMGIYDVHIASATATSGIEAHIDGVSFEVAENLKNIILGKIRGGSYSSANTQTPIPQPQSLQANPVQFSKKISSDTYPISVKWIWSAMVGALFSSLVFSLILISWLKAFISNFGYAFLIIFVCIFFIYFIYMSIWKKNFYFEFTPDYILLRTGVISRQENHLPYKSIQNVLNKQSIIDRILGLSKVTIQNAAIQMVPTNRGQGAGGSGISLVWQPREKAEELSNILNDIVSKINPQNQNNSMGL